MEQQVTYANKPRPVERVTLTLSAEELVFLALSWWTTVDGYDLAWNRREEIGDALLGAFKDAFGVDLDNKLVAAATAGDKAAFTHVARAKALCRHLGLIA